MKEKIKYFYCFRPQLNTHVQFYLGWVNEAKKRGVPIRLITFLPIHRYLKDIQKVKKLKKEEKVSIIPVIPGFKNIAMITYFLFQKLFSSKVVIHLKKVDPSPVFSLLKRVTSNFKLIIDIEGDFESERDYLLEHPYKPGFYNRDIEFLAQNVTKQKSHIELSDTVISVNDNFRKLLSKRYPHYINKFQVLPTGVDTDRFYFNLDERISTRKKLNIEDKLVFIFTGNVYYSWQNISRTLEIFSMVKKRYKNAFFILLTRNVDIKIAGEFIKKYNIKSDDYILRNVPNEEVRAYLNAADIGVLLRHDHIMNRVASPGKIGEYVACGLKLLITPATTNHSDILAQTDQAILIENMDDDDEILNKIMVNINDTSITNSIKCRQQYSKENCQYYSNAGSGETYVNILKMNTRL
jgi:hypothetical protein